jgi:hypothetical protein
MENDMKLLKRFSSWIIAAIFIVVVAMTATVAYAVVKVNVCHATSSPVNPYNLVVVSVQSVEDALNLGGHGREHPNDAWHAYEFEGVIYPGQNEDVFGSLIDDSCNLIVPPTSTPNPTDTATPTATATSTLPPPPTDTPTGTPTNDPNTPTPTATGTQPTQTPTKTATPVATKSRTATPTAMDEPTMTPLPPKPADGSEEITAYPGEEMGTLTIDGDEFALYLGTKANDGTLLLPSYNKGAALYQKVIWIHRAWNTGWIDITYGDVITFTDIIGIKSTYKVVGTAFLAYGVYPKTDTYGNVFQYLATCYSDDKGEWVGVELFKLLQQEQTQGKQR